MAISLTHTTTSAEPDSGDGKISSNAWNEAHTLTMATARILGRTTAGTGAVEELTVGAGLTLSSGSLTLDETAVISDTAFAAAWNGDTGTAPSKNAVYDRLQQLAPVPVTGEWFVAEDASSYSAGTAVTLDTIYYTPVLIQRTITISDLATVHTGTTGVGNFKLALYANNASTNRPTGTPIAETGNISTNTGGFLSADITGANVTIVGGTLVWLAIWSSITGPQFQASNAGGGTMLGTATGTDLFQGGASVGWCLSSAETFGTWPDAASETFSIVTRASRIGRHLLIAKAA